MPTITVTDQDGTIHLVEAQVDDPLMWSLRDSGLPVEGTCGGSASCGTCHVYLQGRRIAELGARTEAEADMLALLDCFDEATSRLSCQMTVTDDFQGLQITVAPPEL